MPALLQPLPLPCPSGLSQLRTIIYATGTLKNGHKVYLAWYLTARKLQNSKQKAEQLGPAFLLHLPIAFPRCWSPGPARASLCSWPSSACPPKTKHNPHKNPAMHTGAGGAALSNTHCNVPLTMRTLHHQLLSAGFAVMQQCQPQHYLICLEPRDTLSKQKAG